MGIPLWAYPVLILFDISFWLAHEAGHVIAWRMMGVSPKRIAFRWWPFVLGIEYKADQSELKASQKLLGAMCGPIASVYFSWLAWQVPMHEFKLLGFASLVAAVISLLPFPNSDGWKIGKYSYQLTKQGVKTVSTWKHKAWETFKGTWLVTSNKLDDSQILSIIAASPEKYGNIEDWSKVV